METGCREQYLAELQYGVGGQEKIGMNIERDGRDFQHRLRAGLGRIPGSVFEHRGNLTTPKTSSHLDGADGPVGNAIERAIVCNPDRTVVKEWVVRIASIRATTHDSILSLTSAYFLLLVG